MTSSPAAVPSINASSSIPQAVVRQKYNSIQVFRAVAALLVCVEHTHAMLSRALPAAHWDSKDFIGVLGVDIFFVISGFIIYSISYGNRAAPPDARDFMVSRIARVVPLYWLATLMFILSAFVIKHERFPIEAVVRSFFLIPASSLDSSGRAGPVYEIGWTLIYEWYFYVVFAVFLLINRSHAWLLCLVTFTVITIAGALLDFQNTVAVTYADPIVLEFLMGILIAKISSVTKPPFWLAAGSLLIGSVLILFCCMNIMWLDGAHRWIVFGIPAAMLIYGGVSLDKIRPQWISGGKFLYSLGDSSYSLYMLHMFVLLTVIAVLPKFGPLPAWVAYAMLTIIISIQILVANASFRWIEIPCQRMVLKSFGKRRV